MKKFLAILCLLSLPLWARESEVPIGAVVSVSGPLEIQETAIKQKPVSVDAASYFPQAFNANTADNVYSTQVTPWTRAEQGQALQAGSRLRTGSAGASVSFSDGVQLRLDQNTEVTLESGGRVRLVTGRVWLKTDRPFELANPEREVKLADTEVVLSSGQGAATLSVLEGQASVAGIPVDQGQSVDFTAAEWNPPVAIEVAPRRAWVKSGTAPEWLPVEPLVPPAQREEVRRQALADPASNEGRLAQTRLYLDEGRLDEARKSLEQLPASDERSRLAGRLLLLEGKFAEAQQHLGQRAPVDSFVAAWAQGRVDPSLVQDEQNPAALAARGYLIEFEQGHYPAAAGLLERAVTLAPDNALYHRQLGDIYAALSRRGAALEQLRQAYQLDPAPTTALRLGSFLIKQGQYDEAVSLLEQFRRDEADPRTDVHHALALGFSKLRSGDLAGANDEAERALQLSETLDPGLRYLAYDLQGLVLAERHQYQAAAAAYRSALDLRPSDPFVLNDLALSVRALGDLQEAQKNLRKARDQAPDSPVIRGNLGFIYSLLNQNQRALNEVYRALEYSPDDAQLLSTLGVVASKVDRLAYKSLAVQARLLDPLVNTSNRVRWFVLGATSPDGGPVAAGNVRGRLGNASYSLSGAGLSNVDNGTTDDALDGRGEFGWAITPRDHLALFVQGGEVRSDGLLIDGFVSSARNELGYYRELSPGANLWALARTKETYSELAGQNRLSPVRRSEQDLREFAWELRYDQRLSPANVVSLGYLSADSYLPARASGFRPTSALSTDIEQQLSQFWLQDSWYLTRGVNLVVGAVFANASYAESELSFTATGRPIGRVASRSSSAVDPFAALTVDFSDRTQMALTYLRSSALQRLGADRLTEPLSRLRPMVISPTTAFPFTIDELAVAQTNALGGILGDLTDWRARFSHELNDNVFVSLEYGHTDIEAADILGISLFSEGDLEVLAPGSSNLLRNEQHSIDQLRFDAEFWDGADTAGVLTYRWRDARFDSGPEMGLPWLNVPEHELDLRLLRRLSPTVGFELNPVYQSGLTLDRNLGQYRADAFRLDAAVSWSPLPESTLVVGYQNIFNDRDSTARSGVFTSFYLQY
ncbi:MAG: tetratricopeptide repeat protein [Vulcanimicrobiota bacterium]